MESSIYKNRKISRSDWSLKNYKALGIFHTNLFKPNVHLLFESGARLRNSVANTQNTHGLNSISHNSFNICQEY